MLDRLREDFRLAIITLCGALAVIGILPFAIYRFAIGQMLTGLLDLLIVTGAAAPAVYAWISGRTRGPGLALAVAVAAGCVAVAWVLGLPGLFWAYPTLLIIFFLVPKRVALALNVLTLGAIVLLADQAFADTLWRFSFFVSASLVGIYAYILALRTEQQRQKLEALASLDPLTGAGNRRLMEHELSEAIAGARRGRMAPALAIMDLDHFKLVNDRHGHEAGDRVLKDFAAIVRGSVRKLDRFYRFGGEEFVLLLPATDAHGLATVVDKLHAQVREQLRGPGGAVTVSIGATPLREGERWASWLARADAALYRAKRGGRNKVVIDHQPTETEGPMEVPAGRVDPSVDRRRS